MRDFFHPQYFSAKCQLVKVPEHIRCFASSVAAKGILPSLSLYNFLFLLYQHKLRDISDDASGL